MRYIILTAVFLCFITLCLVPESTSSQTVDNRVFTKQHPLGKTIVQPTKQKFSSLEQNTDCAVIFIVIILAGLYLLHRNRSRYIIKKKGSTYIVIDGDTFWSKRYKNKIRICGIDCPEKGEPGYKEAKDFLYSLLSNGSVRIKKKGIDKYGRIVAEVFVNGENVARKIKEKGLDKFDNKYQQRFLKK